MFKACQVGASAKNQQLLVQRRLGEDRHEERHSCLSGCKGCTRLDKQEKSHIVMLTCALRSWSTSCRGRALLVSLSGMEYSSRCLLGWMRYGTLKATAGMGLPAGVPVWIES